MMKTKQAAAAAALESGLAEAATEGRSPWRDARVRFLRNKAAVVSLVILSLITVSCIFGPMLLPHGYADTDWDAISLAPTFQNLHLFGTDELGRDLLVRTLIGGRISLMVGALATIAAVLIGVIWGATAGFLGGKVDNAMMRVVDMMYAVPYLLIAILMVTLLGREFYLVVLTITVLGWMDMARVVRGQTLAIRSKEYIEAAHAIGVSTPTIIFRHIVPNLLGIVVIYTTVTVPGVILTESVLSFLGLGVQEPMTSWGVLIGDGTKAMESQPWMLLFPAGMLSLTLYCANYIGDGLRDALDPKDR
ncbi:MULTISPECIES: ABC transporter permease [Chromobacteriaceae]|uniref:Oligopeptide transport system permease protein OppC n=3 Tax=Chromobacteriaceae TaxID=1499392 RepID=A0A1D9LJ72_9NEIS|nr:MULTISPECIES: ABC transporter permease subunit [Chromobacteriaceae]AOZ51312.1 peptide ABC transporter permease [Chromobacterium vaccinii]AVG15581.1 peptide ABC transporter permease [Chromobacterium vaccinii]ERE06221.1 peptide ABC transporter permease [Pseudogulbenkiania ferrooxidans EGD-HP2]MCD4501900.1 ABC transporter permease subunit [Chromobacterium vaccinii]QND87329.1 Oligopeptide ABC transporter permease protein OppC [Chromobacterium vaccinii]